MFAIGHDSEEGRFLEALNDFSQAKNHMVDWLLHMVRDENVPLSTRVAVWERAAHELLEISGWISGNPFHGEAENPFDYDFRGRGEVIMFRDLVENLVPETEEFEVLWELDTNEEILEMIDDKFPKLKERFDAVFRNGKAGFTFDW